MEGSYSFLTFRVNSKNKSALREESFYNLDLTLSRYFFSGSLGLQEMPIISDRPNTSPLSKRSLLYAGLGILKSYEVRSPKPLFIELAGGLRLPINALKSSSPEVSNPSGYQIQGSLRVKVPLSSKNESTWFLIWHNDFSHQNLTEKAKLSRETGTIRSRSSMVTSAIGLGLDF